MKSLKEYDIDEIYKSLLMNIPRDHAPILKSMLEDTIKKHYRIFDSEFFSTVIDENKIRDYVLPSVRAIYYEFFLEKQRFINWSSDGEIDKEIEKRKKIFELSFNLKEFLKFLSKKTRYNIKKLDDFENVDKIQTLMGIIKDDYVAMKYYKCAFTYYPDKDLRDIKINNIIDDD